MRLAAGFALFIAGGCSSGPGKLPDFGGPPVGDGGAVGLPGGGSGIQFDDLRFSTRLDRTISPARSTGNVDLVDPVSLAVVKPWIAAGAPNE